MDPESVREKKTDCSTTTEVLLYVGTVLLFMGVVLSLAVLMLCRTKSRKPEGKATGYTHVTKAIQSLNLVVVV